MHAPLQGFLLLQQCSSGGEVGHFQEQEGGRCRLGKEETAASSLFSLTVICIIFVQEMFALINSLCFRLNENILLQIFRAKNFLATVTFVNTCIENGCSNNRMFCKRLRRLQRGIGSFKLVRISMYQRT